MMDSMHLFNIYMQVHSKGQMMLDASELSKDASTFGKEQHKQNLVWKLQWWSDLCPM